MITNGTFLKFQRTSLPKLRVFKLFFNCNWKGVKWTYLSLSLPISISVCRSICLPVCLSVCLSVYLSIYLCLSVCLSVYLSIYPSVCLSILYIPSFIWGVSPTQKIESGEIITKAYEDNTCFEQWHVMNPLTSPSLGIETELCLEAVTLISLP